MINRKTGFCYQLEVQTACTIIFLCELLHQRAPLPQLNIRHALFFLPLDMISDLVDEDPETDEAKADNRNKEWMDE